MLSLRDALLAEGEYVFAAVAKRVREYKKENENATLIPLGIGDVTFPLPVCVTDEMAKAARELASKDTFRGYPPAGGYPFLREAIASDYARLGVRLSPDEITVSDGAKSDCGDLIDLFENATVLIPSPAYPAYEADAEMCRHSVVHVPTDDDGYPHPPKKRRPYLIVLCSPNNPTGVAYPRSLLGEWIAYACESGSILLFDRAYDAYLTSGDSVRSIYEIDGGRECAIEIGSFSKGAGMTGVRCGWCVIPRALTCKPKKTNVAEAFSARQNARSNGVSYITQRGAAAALSDTGRRENADRVAVYLARAHALAERLQANGASFLGGTDSPYLWVKCPMGMRSEAFFDLLLTRYHIVSTPGIGFGDDTRVRLSSFAFPENTYVSFPDFQ